MNIEEIQQKILTDDDFVLAEVERIQHLYNLKREIRYAQKRIEKIRTESVAEHVYGMHIVSNYFIEIEDPERNLNHERIMEMITWHDIGEIETGDMLGHLKTKADRERDLEGNKIIIEKMPFVLSQKVSTILAEYESQLTPESKFAKAIDKTEVIFEIFDDNYREIFKINRTTKEQGRKTKFPYLQDHPYMFRFCEVVVKQMESQGFFYRLT